jgi:hypothetical protein
MMHHEFLKGGVTFILDTGTPVAEINVTFPSPLCDLRDLSEAGVKIIFDSARSPLKALDAGAL